MQDKLSTIIENKGSEKSEILEDIVKKVLNIAELEIDNDSGIDGIEKGLSPILDIIRKQVTEKMAEKKDVKAASCKCGDVMINKQKVSKKIIGIVPYTIHRRSFYCSKCKVYKQPLDTILKLNGRFSLEVKEAMLLLGQRLPFEESSVYLKTLLNIEVSHESIQTLVEDIGKQVFQTEKQLVKKTVDSDGRIKNWKESSVQKGTAYMELDGCMVQTREDSWKEVRNGILFKAKDRVQMDKHHKVIFKKKYFSVFNEKKGSLKAFKDRTTQEAYEFKFHDYEQPVIIADGAKWIWDYADSEHPNAIQILDYYHASEYLGDAWQSLVFVDTKDKKKFKKQLFDWLWDGKIKQIIMWLNKQYSTEQIEDCIRYFSNNIERMNYGQHREKGIDISSGVIESAHRIIVQTRMKQAGMHWGKKNVQSILSLRAKYLSGGWDDIVNTYLKAA